jgi:hypothetical protein
MIALTLGFNGSQYYCVFETFALFLDLLNSTKIIVSITP